MPAELDEELVRRAQRGDRVAYGDLFERHHSSLLNYVYHMTGDRQQAEDIGHEAFLRAYERIGDLGPPWDFKSWLYRIASHLALDGLRRQHRWVDEPEETLEGQAPTTPRPVERVSDRAEKRQRVWTALGAMPTAPRQALILRDLSGLSYREMGLATGMSEAGARQRVHRAREMFRGVYGLPRLRRGCQALSDLLSAYHDGELSGRDRRSVERHLAACADCREARRDLEQVSGLILGLPRLTPSRAWRQRFLDRMSESFPPGSPAIPTVPGAKGKLPGRPSWAAALGSERAALGGLAAMALIVAVYAAADGSRRRLEPAATLEPTVAPTAAAAVERAALGSLAGWTYMDANASGVREPGEGAVSGALLTLKQGLCPGSSDLLTTESDSAGRYLIPSLSAGEYCVVTSPLQQSLDPVARSVTLGEAEEMDEVNFRYLPEPLASPSPGGAANAPMAVAIQDVACRLGPDSSYGVVDYLMAGEASPIEGRLPRPTWWLIARPDQGGTCWVPTERVEITGTALLAPLVLPPPLPTDTLVPGCLVFNANLQRNVCIVPCPPNPIPGGACTP